MKNVTEQTIQQVTQFTTATAQIYNTQTKSKKSYESNKVHI